MPKIPRNARLCFIVNQFRDPALVVATLILEGETEKDVQNKLDRALATLPFRTLYSYITANSALTLHDIFGSIFIKKIVDYPGLETVKIALEVRCESKYFLPRDPRTGDFIEIDKQVKCLEALKIKPMYKYPQT